MIAVQFPDGIVGGFTDRGEAAEDSGYAGNLGAHVGDDPAMVQQRRAELLDQLAADRLCFVRQVHGADVIRVTADLPTGVIGLDDAADAMVTTAARSVLAILTADCLPVLLADPVAGVIGAAHAGRPGLVAGVLPATVRAMAELGASADRTIAVVGPGICGRCYEVPASMRDEVAAAVPGTAAATSWGTPSVDLRAGAHHQLTAAGVGGISDDDRCTRERQQLPSYRRDGITGRFAGWILLA